MSRAGLVLVLIGAIAAIAAPALAPYGTDVRFVNLLNAPPTRPRLIDDAGRWRAPFIYPWTLADRLAQRYEQDRSRPVPLVWFSRGRLVASSDAAGSAAAAARRRQLRPRRLQPAGLRRARVARAVGAGGVRVDARRRPARRARRLRRRDGGRSADAGDRLRDGPAGDVRRARAEGGAAAGARPARRLRPARPHLRGRRRAVRLPRRPRHRAPGAAARVRRGRGVARRGARRGCSAVICCRPRAASWRSR